MDAVRDHTSMGPKTMREVPMWALVNGGGGGDGDEGVRPRRVNGKGKGGNRSAAATPARRSKAETDVGRGSSTWQGPGRGASVGGMWSKRRRDK